MPLSQSARSDVVCLTNFLSTDHIIQKTEYRKRQFRPPLFHGIKIVYKSVMYWQGWRSGLAQSEIRISHFLPLNLFLSCFLLWLRLWAFLGLICIILCFFHCLLARVRVFISRLMWHCWPVLTSPLLSQEKKCSAFINAKKCSRRAQTRTRQHTNSQYESYAVTDIEPRAYKAAFLPSMLIL